MNCINSTETGTRPSERPLGPVNLPPATGEIRGGTRVLSKDRDLWYRSAIVFVKSGNQYWAVWARFVLITSLLMCFRFSTLLTRHLRHKPAE